MALWIPITIFAAFTQNIRSSLQKYLKGRLTTSGVTFSRFAYAVPLAALYLGALLTFGGYDLPVASAGALSRFAVYAAIGGLGQIVASGLLIHIFSFRNFAVGTTFTKTETVQAALFGIIVLGESVSPGAMAGIGVSLIGVVLISATGMPRSLSDIARQCVAPPAVFGIASGACFGVSAVGYRAAALSLETGDFIIRAAFTLACVTTFQTIVTGIYLHIREPGQITAVLRAWRVAALVGLTGMLASVGWFSAVTLQNAAYVRALGQVELLFTFAASYLIFRERPSTNELAGIAFVTMGVLLLVLAR